jgi:hypothetical protein
MLQLHRVSRDNIFLKDVEFIFGHQVTSDFNLASHNCGIVPHLHRGAGDLMIYLKTTILRIVTTIYSFI